MVQCRIGRPMKKPLNGKRVMLGLRVTADVKRAIDTAAKASGRSQSQEAELLIEMALQTRAILDQLARSK